MKYNVIIGGPGGSGSSAISKKVAEKLGFSHIYGGAMMRKIAKEKGYLTYNQFLESVDKESIIEYDKQVDKMILEELKKGSCLAESKIIATVLPKEVMPPTIKLWLSCDIDIRTVRTLTSKRGLPQNQAEQLGKESPLFLETKNELKRRYEIDGQRYKELYNVDYDKPEKYYDLVLNTSEQSIEETFKLVIDFIEEKAGAKKIDVINDPLLTEKEHDDNLYLDWTRKKCLKCNLVIEKSGQVNSCPRCMNSDPDLFEDID